MHQLRVFIGWSAALCGVGHLFCCGLPILFSLMGLLSGVGFAAVLPVSMIDLDEKMHLYEMPVIITSFCVLCVGWGLNYLAYRIDCHETGCSHGPCTKTKNRSGNILKIATVLFLVNVTVYMILH